MNDSDHKHTERDLPREEDRDPGFEGAGDDREQAEALRRERDEMEGKWRRVLADFQNYQRRSLQNEAEARERGVSAVVESVITAMDHFEKALSHDASRMTAEQLVGGVKMIHEELVKAIARHGARVIEPKVNDEFDPLRHQAVAKHEAQGVGPGRIVQVLQSGYAMGERTIRPAMVVVAPQAD